MQNLLKELHFENGLIPAVIVDAQAGQVLTLCYMNELALRETIRTGSVHAFRRAKGRVMKKGETSGHTQRVVEMRIDCEGNSLLIAVDQRVAACHAGYRSCYFRRYQPDCDCLEVSGVKAFDPNKVYGGGGQCGT